MNRTRQTAIAAAIFITGCALPILAQSHSGDPLAALLNEVHQLRLTMERAAATTPQIQLLATRLAVQNERVSSATRDVVTIRREIDQAASEVAMLKFQEGKVEDGLATDTDPTRRLAWADRQSAIKQAIEQVSAKEQRLRAREAEMSTALAAEQTQWMELNRRLDELEREIAARRPK
jgi:chromosome segregation ATPase